MIIAALALASQFCARGEYEHVLTDRYVGPQVCARCHPRQAESWQKTRMANSFDVLRARVKPAEKKMGGLDPDKDYTRDPFCLPCHTTGYGLTGGFVSLKKTPGMAGVTCEACHGHGGTYANTIMNAKDAAFKLAEARMAGFVYPPTARICRRCHNEDSPFSGMVHKFDLKKQVKKGTHAHFELKYDHGAK